MALSPLYNLDATPSCPHEKCLEHDPDDPMVLCNYAALIMDKREYQRAEVLFKKTLDIQAVPNAYYGLALLYRMADQLEAARSVLETYFTRFSHQKGPDVSSIHDEARKLYNEISAELRVQEKSH